MDRDQGVNPIGTEEDGLGNTTDGSGQLERESGGKYVGLVLGCVVVAIMLVMMFAILGGLLSRDQ